ncbi:hypothetical protein IC614_11320 [Allosphingosinicella flava]|uniref:Pilus assembly protein TadE n=1 Tax=Allosphingosinicella flava TaxID=2771430 RepID=A0A7T2GJB3_9SPHN|nr:hypothetical protein [Sphingosinicella flava]QPQ54891.1 hypothetical protein IC614_11320 [Sphingosinicella flava]
MLFLARCRRGVAYIEFALALPVILIIGLYGIEAANLALAHLRMSQISSSLADTASRISESTMSSKRIREVDINDAFQGARLQGKGAELTQRGRIILSSLEQNADGGQWIHWQRCIGRAAHVSSYGVQGRGAAGMGFPGMGPADKEVKAPPQSSVMFVELFYRYRPLISKSLFGEPVIRATSAFLTRETRDLSNANNPANPAPAVQASTCDRYTA